MEKIKEKKKSKDVIQKDFVIEKTDVVVIFSEIDTRFIKDEFFAGIAALETDNFGSTYVKNPSNPIFQLTLPQSRVVIQILGNKLIVTDSSGKLPKDSELIKRYFASIYNQITSTVPCAVSAYGFNYSVFIQEATEELDNNFGLKDVQKSLDKAIKDYTNSYLFQEGDIKYTLLASTIGNRRKIQLNAHYDNTKDLSDCNKVGDNYKQSWDYFIGLITKLKAK